MIKYVHTKNVSSFVDWKLFLLDPTKQLISDPDPDPVPD